MRRIDLHVHTTASDGTFTPAQVVELARDAGLSAIAITDHDTVSGYAEAAKRGAELGVEIVPGIEISTKYGGAVHVLGYYIDMESDGLHHILDWIVEDRDTRGRKMAELMAADGLPVNYDEMKARFGEVIGRPHFALCLVEAGIAESVQDAFVRFLDPGCKYYIRRHFLSVEDAAELIRSAGGKPVIAHPRQYKLTPERFTELMERARACGVAGLECYYSGYDAQTVAQYLAAAEQYGFCPTAGSDWHGKNKPHIHLGSGMNGELAAPYELLEKLRDHE